MVTNASAVGLPIPMRTEPSAKVVYEINPLSDTRWEAFVNHHPRASVFHSTNWLRALQTTYQYDPLVVTTCPPDAALTNGLVFCRVKSWLTGRRFVSLPFSDHCEPLVKNPTDLGKTTQELFHNFHKDCIQRKIRRAERENLQYDEGTSEDLLQKFYRLLVMTRRRQQLPPQPLDWFRGLIGAFGKNLKIRVASKDCVAVACILTLSHKKSMVYKYGCSDAVFNNLGGTALVFWKAIQEAKDAGFDELDMGRSNTDNPGLIAFKEHWGAARTSMTYWTYPRRPAESPAGWKRRIAGRVVSAAPDLALEAVGNLLYRHIG